MFHQFVVWLAGAVGKSGYPGIVILMALVDGCSILALSIGENETDVHGIRKADDSMTV
jgi:Na+(H+)/acetate symporter ActP